MILDEVKLMFSLFDMRERLIVKLGTLCGMRPGEIFSLKWSNIGKQAIQVRNRVYRGVIDSPKTRHSIREVALPDHLYRELEEWRGIAMDSGPDAWLFPSERLVTPMIRDNLWRRFIAPKLKEAGIDWVTFQVMRRTHSSLLSDMKVDPKVVADHLGHTLDVNQNVYTRTSLQRRKEAVNIFEAAVEKQEMEQFGATTLIEFPVSYRKDGAGDGDRTRDVQLGKLAFYR